MYKKQKKPQIVLMNPPRHKLSTKETKKRKKSCHNVITAALSQAQHIIANPELSLVLVNSPSLSIPETATISWSILVTSHSNPEEVQVKRGNLGANRSLGPSLSEWEGQELSILVWITGSGKGGEVRLPESGKVTVADEWDVKVELELTKVEVGTPEGEEEVESVDSWWDREDVGVDLALVGFGNSADVAGADEFSDHLGGTLELGGVWLEESGGWVHGGGDAGADGGGGVLEVVGNVVLDVLVGGEGWVGEEVALVGGVTGDNLDVLPVVAGVHLSTWEITDVGVIDTWTEAEGSVLRWLNDTLVGGLEDLRGLGAEAVEALSGAASERGKGFVLGTETLAGVHWLESRGLDDGTLEEWVAGSSLGNEMVHDGTSSGRLSHGGDGSLVTVQEVNVRLNPLESSTLIMETKVSNTLSLWNWSVQPSESTELLI